MAITYVQGDPLLTEAQVLAFDVNGQGRAELKPLQRQLYDRHPAAFATFGKQARQGRVKTGQMWLWRETQPQLGFMIVRASLVGATRLRYVEEIALTLARDYQRDNIQSIAIAPLGDSHEWPALLPVLAHWLDHVRLPCFIYDAVLPE